MSFFRRRKLAIFFGIGIGLPVTGLAAGGAYIQYRIMTRPPEHTFKPLVDSSGRLLLEDCVIPAPTNWELAMRIVELLRVFAPVVFLYIFVWWDEQKNLTWWLIKLREAVQEAGPAFVKAGQWSCTRNDLFSPQFRKVFEELYCEARTHSFEETRAIIEHDFKRPLEEIFERVDPVPIGSGSIGQVHDGRLKDGRRVAIKVMHPRVVETIAKDFFVINFISRMVDKYAKSLEHYNIKELGLAWTNHLAAQLDFRIEMEHLELFRRNFMNTDYVEFPEPIQATQRVLIEGFVVGEAATQDFLKSQEPHMRDILAAKGLNCFCKMLMRDNFLHGDLHPGNILIDTRDPHNPKVYLIDVGLCQKMTDEQSKLNQQLMGAWVRWDPQMCSDALWNMGTTQRFSDKAQFDADVRELFKLFAPVTGEEEQVIGNVLQSCFDIVRANRVSMDPPFVSTMFATLILESFLMALNENFNLVQHSASWLIGEGHLSGSLLRNSLRTGRDVAYARMMRLRSQLLGKTETQQADERYETQHRKALAARFREQNLQNLEGRSKA